MTDKDSLIILHTQDALVAVLCRTGLRTRETLHLSRVPCIESPNVPDRNAFRTETLRHLLETLPPRPLPQDVRLCLETDKALFRHWSFPFRSRTKVGQALSLLLDNEYALEGSLLEHRFCPAGQHAGQTRVLSVSLLREELDGWLEACAENNLFPRIVTTAPFPLVSALPKLSGLSLLIQLQEKSAVLALLDGNTILRACPVTHNLAASRPVSLLASLLARETSLMLEGVPQQPERLLLYGPPLLHHGADTAFAESFAMPAVVLGRDLPLSGQRSRLGENDTDHLLGLCVSTLPSTPFRQTTFPSFHRKHSPASSVAGKRWTSVACGLLLVGAVGLLSVWAEGNALERQALRHEQETRALFRKALPDVRGNFGPTQMESILKTRIAALRGPQTEAKAFPVLRLLHDLHAAAPAGQELRLDRLSLDTRRCTLSGTAQSYDQVNRLRDALTGLSGIREVRILNAANQTGKAAGTVLFELDLTLEGDAS